jgi:hypothetical protein
LVFFFYNCGVSPPPPPPPPTHLQSSSGDAVQLSYDNDNRLTSIDNIEGTNCSLQYSPSGWLHRVTCRGDGDDDGGDGDSDGYVNTTTFVTDPATQGIVGEYTQVGAGGARSLSAVLMFDVKNRLAFEWRAASDSVVHNVRGGDGMVFAELDNVATTLFPRYPLQFAAGGGYAPGRWEEVGTTLVRRIHADALLYVSRKGRVFDASTHTWLSEPPTNCDIPRTGHGSYSAQPTTTSSRHRRAQRQQRGGIGLGYQDDAVLRYWGSLSPGDATWRALSGAANDDSAPRGMISATQPVADVVGEVESAPRFGEALAEGHLPGDDPSWASQVGAVDVNSMLTFVRHAQATNFDGLTAEQT